MDIDVTIRKNLKCGMLVDIVAEEDKATQNLTRGYISEIVTKDNTAKKITVILVSGKKGVVKHIVTKDEVKRENFKFYNLFFFDKSITSIWDKSNNRYLVIDHLNRTTGNVEKTAFLFNDDKIAQEVLNGLKNKDYILRTVNRKKPIVENFKTLDVQYFRINRERKLPFDRMIEWENYFKNMR